MRVEMLRSRIYRGEPLEAGRVTDMDRDTARWFIASGWARPFEAAAPLTPEAAPELVPTRKRRNAIR